MTTHFTGGYGSLFAQVNGPNTRPAWMGCHTLGDTTEPLGDVTPIRCRDGSGPRRYKVVGQIQGSAGAITTTVTADVTDEPDELEYVRGCTFNLYVNMSVRGRSDQFANASRTFIYMNARMTQRGLSNLVARDSEDEDRSEQTFDISAEELIRYFSLTLSRQSISEVNAINDISFCNDEQCRTDEDVARAACEIGYAVADAAAGSPAASANVLKTTTGSSWAATAADPFDVGEDLVGVECVDMGGDTYRVIVARGGTAIDEMLEIAYSDDGGASWVKVNVGAILTQFPPSRHSLHALDQSALWIGSNDGYIYYSEDAGISWDAQTSGDLTAQAIHCIRAVDGDVVWACGAANVIMRTLDGGDGWSLITGPSEQTGVVANVIEPLDRNRAWVGYADGKLFYTADAGTTWTEKAFSGSGVGEVRDIKFMNDVIGYMAVDNASPVGTVLVTRNGGYTWEAKVTPTNAGLNAIWLCNEFAMFVVGEAQGGTGYIAKAIP